MAATDFNKVTPLDARLLLSREVTGAGGDDAAPTAALASTEYVDTTDLVSVRVFAYADDATGTAQTFTITPWYYTRAAGRDPLGGAGFEVWHMGKPVPVLLGYDDADANKGFTFDTQNADRMFFQVTDIPGALAWGRTDIYVDIARREASPVYASGLYSALKAIFNFSAGGGLVVDTELTLDATNVFVNNAFSFAVNPAVPTTAGFAKMNAANQVETDTMLLSGNAIDLGSGAVSTGTQRVTLATDAIDGPDSLLGAPQDVTAAWVDLGAEITMGGYTHLGVWVDLDINDSENVRIRALAKHTAAGGDEYFLPILSVSVSDIKIQDEYFEFNEDIDQKVLVKVPTDNLVPVIQLQVMAGVVGGTAGQVDDLQITRSRAGSSGR